ncbi:hypothetical protein NGA35_15615 [Pseudomonas stutzeri]|nr:hypothetical protein [Stutzerimonas stutzeri]
MPQTITTTQIQSLQQSVQAGGVGAAVDAYGSLYAQGYNYAGWAGGVAAGDTISGQAALSYMQGTAAMGIGGEQCRNLTQQQIDKIRTDMANQTLEKYKEISIDNGGALDRDLTYQETKDVHDKVFRDNGLTLDNWTLNTPMELIRDEYGDQFVEDVWEGIRDTGGDGPDAIRANLVLMAYMLSKLRSEDSAVRDKAREWLSQFDEPSEWQDIISDFVNENFNLALDFILRSDPLTLDLDGDGIETVSADTGIVFDFDGDGLKTGTGWVNGDDAFLVRDLDGNGLIDNGSELFGVDTLKQDGSKAKDGFDALRDLDSNADGVFDAQDEHFSNVRVWQDLNQDGVSQANELRSLVESSIASINLTSQSTRQTSNDNLISAVGSFTRLDGTAGEVNGNQSLAANLDLASNPFYREYTDRIEISDEVAALPDMQGSGAVRDLQEAAMLDAGLRNVLTQYSQATTREQQLDLVDKLLVEWASSSGFKTFKQRVAELSNEKFSFVFSYSWEIPNSYSATPSMLENKELLEKVIILEVFNGQEFFGFGGDETADENNEAGFEGRVSAGASSGGFGISAGVAWGRNTFYVTEKHPALNSGQKQLLESSYEALRQSVYDGLLLQTRLKPYMDAVSLTVDENGIGFDFSQVDGLFQTRYASAPAEAIRDLLDLQRVRGVDLAALGWEGLGQLNQWLNEALGGPNEAAVLAALADFGYTGVRLQGDNDVVISDANGGVLQGRAGWRRSGAGRSRQRYPQRRRRQRHAAGRRGQ